MCWADVDVGIGVHDRLLEVALDLPGKRLGDVTDGQEAVAVDARRAQDAAASFKDRLFGDLELNPEVLVLVLQLIDDRLKSRELVLVPGAVRPGMADF